MIPTFRKRFNEEEFSEKKYAAFLDSIAQHYRHRPPFPIGETPVFVPASLHRHLLQASEDIIDVITAPVFKEQSASAIPNDQIVPGETEHPLFLQFDFGIVRDEQGHPFPQLVEIQGFPSLYFYQALLEKTYRKFYTIPKEFKAYFSGLDRDSYQALLQAHILGEHAPENVVLMDIEPDRQNTQVDFLATTSELKIPTRCISKIIRDGNRLFYRQGGRLIPIYRIYNRVIFDELSRRDDLQRQFNMTESVEVEWAGHPNWFFRISKHTLPLFDSPYVPKSLYVGDLTEWPDPLSEYVLKPLYSFAGTGVILDVEAKDLDTLDNPKNYILQRKVEYAPVIETPDGKAKCEIRLMFIWPETADRPILVNNLIRLSKGIMVGVRHNKGKTWVGGSIGFFEPVG